MSRSRDINWMPKKNRAKTYIAIYDVGLCFGGREEGGWWYDAGSLVMYRYARNARIAKKIWKQMSALAAQMNAEEGRIARSNTNSTGEYECYRMRQLPAPGFPRHRPRYE